jgi:hypothetical protein
MVTEVLSVLLVTSVALNIYQFYANRRNTKDTSALPETPVGGKVKVAGKRFTTYTEKG